MTVADDLAALCDLEAQIAALDTQRQELRARLLGRALDALDVEGAAPTWRTPLGSVSLSVPKARPVVVDPARLATWVEARFGGDPIEVIRQVRPAWLSGFITFCSVAEAGTVVSTDGEPVDGLVATARPPYLTVRLSKETKAAALNDVEEVKSR